MYIHVTRSHDLNNYYQSIISDSLPSHPCMTWATTLWPTYSTHSVHSIYSPWQPPTTSQTHISCGMLIGSQPKHSGMHLHYGWRYVLYNGWKYVLSCRTNPWLQNESTLSYCCLAPQQWPVVNLNYWPGLKFTRESAKTRPTVGRLDHSLQHHTNQGRSYMYM